MKWIKSYIVLIFLTTLTFSPSAISGGQGISKQSINQILKEAFRSLNDHNSEKIRIERITLFPVIDDNSTMMGFYAFSPNLFNDYPSFQDDNQDGLSYSGSALLMKSKSDDAFSFTFTVSNYDQKTNSGTLIINLQDLEDGHQIAELPPFDFSGFGNHLTIHPTNDYSSSTAEGGRIEGGRLEDTLF